MRVSSRDGWAIQVDTPNSSEECFDALSASMTRGPVINFSVGSVGITGVPNDDTFAIGFVQYVTKYLFQVCYKQGILEIKPPTPINDSDSSEMHELTPDKVALEHPLFYDHPKRVRAKADAGPRAGYQNFDNYRISAADAPSFDFPYYHNDDRTNPLERIIRLHEFQTWAVIWNRVTNAVEVPLVRFVWEHHIDAKIFPEHGHGARIKFGKCYSREIIEKRQVGADIKDRGGAPATLPDAVLRAPTVNGESKKHQYYRNQIILPPLMLGGKV